MNKMQLEAAAKTYDTKLNANKKFCNEMQDLIGKLIENAEVGVHSISGRVKERDNFIKKCQKDKYDDFSQITDVVGIRVVNYLLDEVEEVCKLIESEFIVDERNSGDKSSELNPDQFWYDSIHYVLRLKPQRCELPEYIQYKDMVFEVQVRTLLQHTWAEFSHDNYYKSSREYPREIQRKLSRISAVLEECDINFQGLYNDMKKHTEDTKTEIAEGNLDMELDSTTLTEYLHSKFDLNDDKKTFDDFDKEVIQELKDFGVNAIKDLDDIVESKKIVRNQDSKCYTSLLWDIMIIADAEKYFEKVERSFIISFEKSEVNYFKNYGVDIQALSEKYGFEIH